MIRYFPAADHPDDAPYTISFLNINEKKFLVIANCMVVLDGYHLLYSMEVFRRKSGMSWKVDPLQLQYVSTIDGKDVFPDYVRKLTEAASISTPSMKWKVTFREYV